MNAGFFLHGYLVLLLACGGYGILMRKKPVSPQVPISLARIDLAVLLFLVVGGVLYANALHTLGNPYWNAEGQDWKEFLSFAVELDRPGAAATVGNRYPFYPWLAVLVAHLQNQPVHIGCMQVSIVAAGLLPAALYFLGRQLAPWPIALAGATLSLHGRTLLEMLGPPTDYILYTLLQVFCLAAGAAALKAGGWVRFLGFGLCLALLMATAAKALVVLTVAVPAAIVGLLWHARRGLIQGLVSALLFALPLILTWQIYSHIDITLLPLERLVLTARESEADAWHYHMQAPDNLGWGALPEQHGYWRVGSPDALQNLPKTYTYLLQGTEGGPPFQKRYDSVFAGLWRELPISRASFIFLAIPGCLAVGSFRRRRDSLMENRVSWALAAGYVTAVALAEFSGLTTSMYIPRYGLTMLVILPVFMIGAPVALLRLIAKWPWRDASRHWWPLALLVFAWAFAGDGPLSALDARMRQEKLAEERKKSDYPVVRAIASLAPDSVVLDFSPNYFLSDLFYNQEVVRINTDFFGSQLSVPAAKAEKRFIVQPCLFSQGGEGPRWVADDSSRIRPLCQCIDQDLQPHERLKLQRGP